MRRVVLLIVLIPFSLPAGEDWLYEPPPETEASDQAQPASRNGSTPYRSSATTRAAWKNQADWLSGRLAQSNLEVGSPIHIRVFKQSRELELHVRGRDGFELYRTYPICDMSGSLGPKRFEGDYQAPEGFYTVRSERLHPHSDFHLAFNLGYPNAFDRAMGRTGSNIMIHGGCSSNGCFAMTDYYMEQIYLLADAALRNGQETIGVEIYPFRMTDENLAAHSGSRWIDFWRQLKPAHDHFAKSRNPARIVAEPGGYRTLAGDSPSGNGDTSANAP